MGEELARLERERARLAIEFATLTASCSTRDACLDLVRFVESTPEPLAPERAKDNPWVTTSTGSPAFAPSSCCSVT